MTEKLKYFHTCHCEIPLKDNYQECPACKLLGIPIEVIQHSQNWTSKKIISYSPSEKRTKARIHWTDLKTKEEGTYEDSGWINSAIWDQVFETWDITAISDLDCDCLKAKLFLKDRHQDCGTGRFKINKVEVFDPDLKEWKEN